MATFKDYAEQVRGKVCKWCKTALQPTATLSWDHPGGFHVEGYVEKQWIYTECPNCEYQWALGKLGVADQPLTHKENL